VLNIVVCIAEAPRQSWQPKQSYSLQTNTNGKQQRVKIKIQANSNDATPNCCASKKRNERRNQELCFDSSGAFS
jgi:hypothetical protein